MKSLELVGYGHPDRFADYISEKILSEHLKIDKKAKVASEVMVTKDIVFLGGEISSKASIDYNNLVLEAIKKVYGEKWWPNFKEIKIINNIKEQSKELKDIQKKEIVAGDQGVIYGYYFKKRFDLIKKIYKIIKELRERDKNISPDWKLIIDEEEKILHASFCGLSSSDFDKTKEYFLNYFKDFDITINPKGEWKIGGALSDTGLTGRKIMIDTFGSGIPHGGGAFCGKDFSKVDKTGIIIGTRIAKEIQQSRNYNGEIIVELNYKIGDSIPKCKVLFPKESKREIIALKFSLNDWIESSNIFDIEWENVVLNGGIVPIIDKIKSLKEI